MCSSDLKAQAHLEQCGSFVTTRLVTDGFECHGTLAQNSYLLGKTYRQMSDYAEAEKAFAESIDNYQKRGELRKKRHQEITNRFERELRQQEEYLFLTRRVGIVTGLGLGWLDYTRGRLSSAHQKVITAKILLWPYEDRLNDAYLNLILGSIGRCQAGGLKQNRSKLEAALVTVNDAYGTFRDLKHQRYRARAAYELALINLALADMRNAPHEFAKYISEASTKTREVIAKAQNVPSHRWLSNALVVQSRIARKQRKFEQAETLAEDARATAHKHRQVLCEIDALIALAEIRLVTAKIAMTSEASAKRAVKLLERAREELKLARKLNEQTVPRTSDNQNEKIEIVCALNLARSFAIQGEQNRARSEYPSRSLILKIEHIDIRMLAAAVDREIDTLESFPLDSHSENLSYHSLNKELKRFLMRTAERRGANSEDKLAQALGVTPKAIADWKKGLAS